MRRQEDPASSFDLFLDTVCNTFGGIVFLAILLALMVQTRSVVKTTDESGETPPTPDEIRELIAQLDDLAAKHQSLSIAVSQNFEPKGSPEDAEFTALVAEAKQVQSELDAATQQRTEAARSLATKLAENSQLKSENSKVIVDLASLEESLGNKQSQYEAAIESKKEALRLPKAKESHAAPYLVLLYRDRFHLAKRPSFYGQGFHAAHVDTKTNGTSITVTPKPGAGWDASDANGLTEIDALIAEAASGGNIITLAVWTDSYASFGPLKEKMIAAGVPYQIWFQDEGAVLTLVPGSGASSVQ